MEQQHDLLPLHSTTTTTTTYAPLPSCAARNARIRNEIWTKCRATSAPGKHLPLPCSGCAGRETPTHRLISIHKMLAGLVPGEEGQNLAQTRGESDEVALRFGWCGRAGGGNSCVQLVDRARARVCVCVCVRARRRACNATG